MVKNPSEFQKLLVKFQQQQTEAGLEKRERFHKNLIKVSFLILPLPPKEKCRNKEPTREIILRSRPELIRKFIVNGKLRLRFPGWKLNVSEFPSLKQRSIMLLLHVSIRRIIRRVLNFVLFACCCSLI
ncbi:hypothetical protein CEXT_20901 [Caerostris extrusa]|uniref:Uncharacterized protein n=1 Tax=Caerostris extrusa TaxID=172846 RepID=A0AAV4RDN1_CAEEX|nr:hypothetical protein CEXT_20901 [Caerostris extrusa]